MPWLPNPYTPALLISAAMAAVIFSITWRRRQAPGATPLALLMLALTVWALTYALYWAATDLATRRWWLNATYVGVVTAPTALFAFALQFTDQTHWLTRRNLALLMVEPMATFVLLWTDDWHGLFFAGRQANTASTILDGGVWFWANAIYSYLLVLIAVALLIRALWHAPRFHRGQFGVPLVGALLPWVSNLISLGHLNPFPNLDLTPFMFTLTGLAFAYGLFHFRLLDLVPIGRSLAINNLHDLLLVLDAYDRVVDFNPAAQQAFGWEARHVLGKPIERILQPWAEWDDRYRDVQQATDEISLGEGERRRVYDLAISPIRAKRGRLLGRVILLREITERKQTQEALHRQIAKLQALHEIDQAIATLDLETCLRTIVEHARTLFATDMIAILLLKVDRLQLVAEQGLAPEGPLQLPLDRGLTTWSYHHRQPVLVPDVSQDERYAIMHPQTRAEMVAPLLVHQECIGVINVESSRVDAFHRDDLKLLETLAARAAIAIHNARLHAAEREARELAETLREIGLALTSRLDPDAVLEQLLDHVATVIPFDSATVLLLEGNLVRIKRHRGYERFDMSDSFQSFARPLDELPHLLQMVQTGCAQVVPDTQGDPSWAHLIHTNIARHVRSWIGAPIVVRDELLGFLSLEKVEPGFYRTEMLESLAALATQAGLALQNARLYAEQQHLAMTDSLTSLYNRRYFMETAEREFQRACRHHSPLAVLMLDLNGFKQVNDRYGHAAGDRALQALAPSLVANVRSMDIVARYGGDEFVILLPDCGEPEARRIVARLETEIRQISIPVADGILALSLSIGVAVSDWHAAETLDRLLNRADDDMYRVKARHVEKLGVP